MKVFLTGASGFIGSAVAAELLREGHQVVGLARSDEAAHGLQDMGATVQRGSLEDQESLRAGAARAEGVIHLAFDPDFTRFAASSEVDRQAIEAIGTAISGSGKPFLVPTGMAGLAPSGQTVTEDTELPSDYRLPRVSERVALRLGSGGVLASVVRLAQVHDVSKQGLVTALVGIARHMGVSAYLGDGRQRWSAAHVSDVARLFRLALEASKAGAKYHAVGEEGVEMRAIAEAIGRRLDVPTKSLTVDEARAHFGPMAMFVGLDMPASAAATRRTLNWRPSGPTLIADLDYASASSH